MAIIFDRDLIVPWVNEKVNHYAHAPLCQAIGKTNEAAELVAGVVYEDHNGTSVECHIAAEGRSWADKSFLWVIFDYPFNQLQLSRITVCVLDSNKKSVQFVERLGFELEAILQGTHKDGNTHVYKMTPDKCRWMGVSDESRAFPDRRS